MSLQPIDMSLWRRDPRYAPALLFALLTTAEREVELRNNSIAHMDVDYRLTVEKFRREWRPQLRHLPA